MRPGHGTPATAACWVLSAALAVASTLPSPADVAAQQPPRIVAVGDVHGALDAFRAILLETELVDSAGDWIGGKTVFVQTGDFVDRGAQSILVARWLMKLQAQAAAAGGRVVVLLGNHEALNLIGDMRFVPPEMLQPMVDRGSKKRRLEMCKERASILRRDAKALGEKAPAASAVRQTCQANHALGLVEYQDALRPDHPLGRWLRSLPAVAVVDGILFLHGGISPELGETSIESINRKIHEELSTFEIWRRWLLKHDRMVDSATLMQMARAVQVDRELRRRQSDETNGGETAAPAGAAPDLESFFDLSDAYLLRPDGPLWFRGYDSWTDEEGEAALSGILQAFGVRHVVVGHTPQDPRRIRCRFGGRAFLIDTGMLEEYYKGEPAALQFENGGVEAIYLDERLVMIEPGGQLGDACRSGG